MADLKDTVKSTIEAAGAAVQPTADAVRNKIEQATKAVADSAQGARGYMGEQAENATKTLSGSLKTAAGGIRENVPESGAFGQAARGVAQSFSNTAGYLDREGADGIANGIAAMIKSNPIPAILIGVGIGFLLGRGSGESRS